MRVTIVLIVFFIAVTQSACSNDHHSGNIPLDNNASANALADKKKVEKNGQNDSDLSSVTDPVLARINGKSVRQSEIDPRAKLELFKLDWAKYEARRLALAEHIDDQLEGKAADEASVEVLIRPPQPPRLEWSRSDNQPSSGHPDAPVELSIFCNYQSTHCVGMQETYTQLASIYGDRIRFVFYDFPTRFHRFAPGASQAARCAFAEGEFERFHKALWVDQSRLSKDAYLLTANQLKLDETRFKTCLESAEVENQIRSNLALAQELGFSNVPVTLVNGLYLNGPKDLHVLRFFIDQELERIAIQDSNPGNVERQELVDTELPLRLEGVIGTASGMDDARALILKVEENETGNYKVAQSIFEQVTLLEIHPSYVVLDNKGKKERLRLSQGARSAVADVRQTGDEVAVHPEHEGLDERLEKIEQAVMASGNVLDTDELPPADIEYQYRGVVAPKGESPLSREWLDEQLVAESTLRAHFKPGELEVEGVHLLKLKNIEGSEFYRTLGLQEGDVVMRVNGEWVHEAQNNLFAALESEDTVSVIVMRKGFPVHYHYAIN